MLIMTFSPFVSTLKKFYVSICLFDALKGWVLTSGLRDFHSDMPYLGKLPPKRNIKVNRAASTNICSGVIASFNPI